MFLATLVENYLTHAGVDPWPPFYCLYVYMSILMPAPPGFDYFSFVVKFDTTNFVFLILPVRLSFCVSVPVNSITLLSVAKTEIKESFLSPPSLSSCLVHVKFCQFYHLHNCVESSFLLLLP